VKYINTIIFFIFCTFLLFLSIRGLPGNPTVTELRSATWREEGPFELSPERGRFTLLYSIIENKSFSFSTDLALFAEPDVAYSRGKYVSLFAPGLSFITMPGYLIGKFFGVSQVGTFAIISLFAVLNAFLIRLIAIHLGARPQTSFIAAFAFLFATPAFAYAVNLYQHHISTFLLLFSIYLLVRFKTFWSLTLVWMLCAFSIVIDYPNFFMMLPIGIYALSRLFVIDKTHDHAMVFSVSLIKFLSFVGILLPILFFCWANVMSYGKPLQLAGALERPQKINANGKPVLASEKHKLLNQTNSSTQKNSEYHVNVITYFVNRNIMNGFYIHFISPDRGMIVYTPVMVFAIIGIIIAWKRNIPFLQLLIAISGVNIILYSMWGDPWGGWAFGSRYLIPSYAIFSIFIAIALTYLRKNIFFLTFFLLVLIYSISINTMGAITSSTNPPQVEIAGLEKRSGIKQEYTFMKNAQFLSSGRSKSFVFQIFASRYITAWNYYFYVVSIMVVAAIFFVISLWIEDKKEKFEKAL
jgi:hypothetical protein